MKSDGVHAVVGHVDHPHSQRPCTVEVDAVYPDPETDDGPAFQLLEGPGIESRCGPGQDHIRARGDCDDVLGRLPRAGDQLDVTEHPTFDVEIAEPRSENRHLGPT